MCEFDILLDGEKIFEEAIHLEREGDGNLLARDVLGREKDLGNVTIEEIDVSSEKLVVSSR